MTRARARHGRRGLTLIEIALAISILAMMGAITWGSIARSFDAYETVTQIDARYHNVRAALNRMAREISMAFLTSPDRSRGARELMWKTAFHGQKGTPFFDLYFTSFAHQLLRADAKESDQCEIEYYGEADPDDRSKIDLLRREDIRLDQHPDKGGRSEILAEDVRGFKLRFWDDRREDWTDKWDTEDPEFFGRLPPIVEITLTIGDEDGKDVTFVTKTRINMTTMIPRFGL